MLMSRPRCPSAVPRDVGRPSLGEITPGHARVIARVGADPDHADEAALLEMARGYWPARFGISDR